MMTRDRPSYYRLDEDGEPEPCTLEEWAQQMSARRFDEGWRIAHDRDEGQHTAIEVSTVFLGLDHNFALTGPPILFETLVFGGVLDGAMRRYSTREAALRGHQAMCEAVSAAMTRDEPPGDPR